MEEYDSLEDAWRKAKKYENILQESQLRNENSLYNYYNYSSIKQIYYNYDQIYSHYIK